MLIITLSLYLKIKKNKNILAKYFLMLLNYNLIFNKLKL